MVGGANYDERGIIRSEINTPVHTSTKTSATPQALLDASNTVKNLSNNNPVLHPHPARQQISQARDHKQFETKLEAISKKMITSGSLNVNEDVKILKEAVSVLAHSQNQKLQKNLFLILKSCQNPDLINEVLGSVVSSSPNSGLKRLIGDLLNVLEYQKNPSLTLSLLKGLKALFPNDKQFVKDVLFQMSEEIRESKSDKVKKAFINGLVDFVKTPMDAQFVKGLLNSFNSEKSLSGDISTVNQKINETTQPLDVTEFKQNQPAIPGSTPVLSQKNRRTGSAQSKQPLTAQKTQQPPYIQKKIEALSKKLRENEIPLDLEPLSEKISKYKEYLVKIIKEDGNKFSIGLFFDFLTLESLLLGRTKEGDSCHPRLFSKGSQFFLNEHVVTGKENSISLSEQYFHSASAKPVDLQFTRHALVDSREKMDQLIQYHLDNHPQQIEGNDLTLVQYVAVDKKTQPESNAAQLIAASTRTYKASDGKVYTVKVHYVEIYPDGTQSGPVIDRDEKNLLISYSTTSRNRIDALVHHKIIQSLPNPDKQTRRAISKLTTPDVVTVKEINKKSSPSAQMRAKRISQFTSLCKSAVQVMDTVFFGAPLT